MIGGMKPSSSESVIRVDPVHQPLWRDAETIQFGVDRRVDVRLTEHWHEPLLVELQRGIRPAAFDVIAHGLGAPRDAARAFLQGLRPIMHTVPMVSPAVSVEALHPDDLGLVLWAQDALNDLGFTTSDAAATRSQRRADVAVVLVRGAAPARSFADYLARDRAHLPVALDRGGATVGPLVIPGDTPCLSCRDAHETSRDPAWPLLHAQLIGRTARRISGARVVAATGVAGQLLRAGRPGGLVMRLNADGSRRRWRIGFDERCRCREPWPRSLRETAMVPVHRARVRATTRSKASALPA